MKRFVGIVIIAVMLLQTMSAAGFFSDVDEASEQGIAILKMAERGIVDGVGDGRFKPQDSLTRSQFVKIVNKVFGYTQAGENKFTDVHQGKWYYEDVCIAVEAGYINGVGNGLFAPDDKVSREQVCVIMDNILKMEQLPYFTKPLDKVSLWATDAVYKALSNGLVALEDGDVFRATENMTRGEACLVLEKCLVDVGPIVSINLENIAKDELKMRMERVIDAIKTKVIPELKNEKSKIISQMIIDNMVAYIADNTHDYIKASENTFAIYKTIPKEEREIFKTIVQKYNKLEDLMLLYDFFFII